MLLVKSSLIFNPLIKTVVVNLLQSRMASRLQDMQVETKEFLVPTLGELVKVLNNGLNEHFEKVIVEVVDCPDLREEPFTLASPGLCGNPKLVEVGGPAYLLPLANRSKVYNFLDVAKVAKVNPAFIIGAGAGPFNHEGTNCEGIYNLNVADGQVTLQDSKISRVNHIEPKCPIQKTLPPEVSQFGLLANLFVSEGKPGKVLKVHVGKRIGSLDFIASIRTTLSNYYDPANVVGLGGTFLLKQGSAKTHVMPDFSPVPLHTDEELNKWLEFHTARAPLIAVGTLTTSECDALDLRVQHFHLFSHHGQAGHYHIDTTPDMAEYLAYFNVAGSVIRMDKPPQSAGFGKD